MTEQDDTRRKSRRDLLLILLILPFGILCMLMTGQAAIRLAPTWVLPANMLSNLDPNSIFAGLESRELLEPLNPGILTQPAWDRLFLTPNAQIPTREIVEVPTSIPVVLPTQPPVDTAIPKGSPTPTATLFGPIIIPTSGSREANLAITKSDNSSRYTPGTTISYTIVVRNLGPEGASKFHIEDDIPTAISGLTVNCSPSLNCGTNTSSGNSVFFENANLAPNGQFTITVSGLVSSAAVGNLANTARIRIPSEAMIRDIDRNNNTTTDTDTRFSISDLAITKSDGSDTYTATSPITYTVEATNSGPSDAVGVRIVDTIPSQIVSWTWTCTTVTRAGRCNGVTSSSDFSDTVDIRAGGRIVYTVTANLPANANTSPVSISNTASVLLPSDPNFSDPNTANNSSTDTDIPYIDLQIAKDDGGATFSPGGTLGYTVTVTNNSTFNLTGITVSDPMPTQFTSWGWCVAPCTPNPNSINTDFTSTIDLTAGSSLVYNVTANISGTAGLVDITNTVTVGPPAGLVDADPTNNSATETTTPYIDLQITKTDGVGTYTQGGSLQYIVTVTNNTAFDLNGVTVTDTMPALISSWSWTCGPDAGPPTPTCTTGPSNTDINDTAVYLPAGRSVIYTIDAIVSNTATGSLINTATVSPPPGLTDAIPGNNTAEDIDNQTIEYIGGLGPPDDNIVGPATGNSFDYTLTTPITIDGNTSDYEIVFYEDGLANNTIQLDQVIISISTDGITWYRIYYWGDNIVDTNASPPGSTSEPDNYPISTSLLYGSPPYQTGILIDADGGLDSPPNGIYPYLRVTAPPGDADGGCDIDTIGIWP